MACTGITLPLPYTINGKFNDTSSADENNKKNTVGPLYKTC
jgi:hypothetical protein